MSKSRDAFRTISEVADWLDTPAHVLRFWESKFTQVKPVKRAGGRRYYRPADMELLGGIKKLLHDEGMTIKGVQKVLREKGVKHVTALSQSTDEADEDVIDVPVSAIAAPSDPVEDSNIVSLHGAPQHEAAEMSKDLDQGADLFAHANLEVPDANLIPPADETPLPMSASPDAEAVEADAPVDAEKEIEDTAPPLNAATLQAESADTDIEEDTEALSGEESDVVKSDEVDEPALAETDLSEDDSTEDAEVAESAAPLPSFMRPDTPEPATPPVEAETPASDDISEDAPSDVEEDATPSIEELYGVPLQNEDYHRGPLSGLQSVRRASASDLRAIQTIILKMRALHERLSDTPNPE